MRVSLCSLSPSEFRASAPRVVTDFIRSGTDDVMSYCRINCLTLSRLKRLLHPTIFAGMKRQNRDTPSGFDTERKIPQECVQRTELIVDFNPKRLKDVAYCILVSTTSVNRFGQLHCRGWRSRQYSFCQSFRVRCIGVFAQKSRQSVCVECCEQRAGRPGSRG